MIYEVEYHSGSVEFIEEAQVSMYENEPYVMCVDEVKECRMCGEKTIQLRIVNGLPRCKPCQKSSVETAKRASYYMSCNDDY